MKPKHISKPKVSQVYLGPGRLVDKVHKYWTFDDGYEICRISKINPGDGPDEARLVFYRDGKELTEESWIESVWDELTEDQQELIIFDGFRLLDLLDSESIFHEKRSAYTVRRLKQ